MLTYSDRQKFEQLRARWETVQPPSSIPTPTPMAMAGHKEKPAILVPQSPNVDPNSSGGSKFRRKLSHGLSFISNPLSQRKTMPGRLPSGSGIQSLALSTSGISINDKSIVLPSESDRRLSPARGSKSFDESRGSAMLCATLTNDATTNGRNDPSAMSRPQLPRSRTMSFIPRPNRSGSESSVVESETTPKPRSPPSTHQVQARTSPPTKIPSPPNNKRRHSSPRQYIPQYTTQQTKQIAAGMAFAGAAAPSPSKSSVRSYTTPNLVKAQTPPQSNACIIPRKSALQHKNSGIPGVQRPTLKENTPTGKPESRRVVRIQERTAKRDGLDVPTLASKRRSFGPRVSPKPNRQVIRTTPPTAKRLSTSLSTQTPLTARRTQPAIRFSFQPSFQSTTPIRYSNSSPIVQPRLMAPVNPPTPPKIDQVVVQSTPPQTSTDKNIRKGTFTVTPSGRTGWRNGVGMSVVSANSEVRLPRSTTFHNILLHRDRPPPVPPIPELYKSMSQPLLLHPKDLERRIAPRHTPLPLILESDPAEQHLQEGESEEDHPPASSSPFVEDPDHDDESGEDSYEEEMKEAHSTHAGSAYSTTNLSVFPSISSRNNRPWSIKYQRVSYANSHHQVKDYMPPLWWAGRFQSRFDQWRTDAMLAELIPKHKPEGMPGQCTLSQDKAASQYIFLQLRDLCVSNQAADSLWEFEYKYRQDHELLGATLNDMPPPKRKPDDDLKQGAIGRAVRKLTPRKSSFANLLKGVKGWNKTEGIAEHPVSSGASEDTISS
ncbi:hypothetical protein K504DRAFT_531686 [Pleomassaria siparia CBS 279.74]|uniref:Uncharacterized protein n=1 Tax=Pleomassaria siparia CBS 279.74 TaxID=1314801 RepID=A0A6G1KJG5_9PLEO|nr:hypothetical protein K504DRAFT_531686 [Pleomassaria siparia CBS 279.74]